MRSLETTRQFEKDAKLAKRRGKNLEKLWTVVELLLDTEPLPPRCRPHALTGNWEGFHECHLEPDWLLIWQEDETSLVLVRTGSHADLFD